MPWDVGTSATSDMLVESYTCRHQRRRQSRAMKECDVRYIDTTSHLEAHELVVDDGQLMRQGEVTNLWARQSETQTRDTRNVQGESSMCRGQPWEHYGTTDRVRAEAACTHDARHPRRHTHVRVECRRRVEMCPPTRRLSTCGCCRWCSHHLPVAASHQHRRHTINRARSSQWQAQADLHTRR